MAGRGRGRGRGMSFSIENLGIGRGEAVPGSIQQPPPLFPTLDYKPAPLLTGEEYDYLVALKQEFRSTLRDSPYFIKPAEKKRDVSRYSDKYTSNSQYDLIKSNLIDWSRLPAELEIKKTKNKSGKRSKLSANSGLNAEKKLQELEEQEKNTEERDDEDDDDEDAEAEKDDEDGEGVEDVEDEDELEDETDYNMTYFDNGETFGGDEDDDLDEGPVY